jgi:hypothetical protein
MRDSGMDLDPPPGDSGMDLDAMLGDPGLPEDDDGLDWLVSELGRIMEKGPEDTNLLPVAPCSDSVDIFESCDVALLLPGDPSRANCKCKHQCIKRVMDLAEDLVRHLRDQVRDKHLLLEFVKKSHQSAPAPGTKHQWMLAGLTLCSDALCVLLGISNARLTKIMRSMRTSGICPYSDLRSMSGGSTSHQNLRLDDDAFWHLCYHNFAEPLADADEKARLEEACGSGARVLEYVMGSGGNPLAGATLDLYRGVDRRFMPPMSWDDVHAMYCLLGPSGISSAKASLQLLQKLYKELNCK